MFELARLKETRPTRAQIEVAEWGGVVLLERVPAREQLELIAMFDDGDDNASQTRGVASIVELLTRCVVNDKGERVFGTDAGRDYLERESLGILSKVGDAAMRLHDLGTVEQEPVTEKKSD